jgi:KUP system potassium uptake protein
VWHLKHNRSRHERVLILTTLIEPVPRIRGERLQVQELAAGMWRATARFGFMERPDIPALLRDANALGCGLKLEDVTYYVGRETVIHGEDRKGLPYIVASVFAFLQRNSAHVSDYYRLPAESLIELGREIAI